MPPTPPPVPTKTSKGAGPWLIGGCGCLVLLLLVAAACLYGLYRYGRDKIPPVPGLTSTPTPAGATPGLTKKAPAQSYGTRLDFSGSDVYYTSAVTVAEAQKLGDYLVKNEFFDATPKTVQLNKTGATYEFRMVVKQNVAEDKSRDKTFKEFARQLSENVFQGQPVLLHLCDDNLTTLRVVTPEPVRLAPTATESSNGEKTYLNAAEKMPPALAERFVPFTFQYPASFVLVPQADEIFVTVEKLGGADGKSTTQSFSVAWYEPPAAETRPAVDGILNEEIKKWVAFLPTFLCKEVAKSPITIGGVGGKSVLVEFTDRAHKTTFVAAGKTILLHPPGQKNGVAISLYGTWENPAIKKAADLGVRDDLATILRSFRFVQADNSAKMDAATGQEMVNAAVAWLRLLETGKYAESFATASQSFRKGLTAEQWATNYPTMQKEFGAVVSRADDVNVTRKSSVSDGAKETVTYIVKFNTTFQKKAGTEAVTMEKESNQWKVADYSITTGGS
ncbi:MAG: DUF4019 domain-containing protein [Verrucomicrobiota bacterium]|nr:DUF4019 domain-containing protein [Verrucomicrobiota bacterium]